MLTNGLLAFGLSTMALVSGGGEPGSVDSRAKVPVPTGITGLSPMGAKAGAGDRTITIRGFGFRPGSRVAFNGTPKATTYVDGQHLAFQVTAAEQARAGGFPVQVETGGILANTYNYAVKWDAAPNPEAKWNDPGVGNPFIPGYFADGTVRKFGDTYYLWATSDGVANGGGQPVTWASKDFVNWYSMNTAINTGAMDKEHPGWAWWAPDVTEGPGGTYYLYHANAEYQGCCIYGASSPSPWGPWTSLKGPFVPVLDSEYMGRLPGGENAVLALDGQTFLDDDGQRYLFFCTWAQSLPGRGAGWVKLNNDMKSFSAKGIIPNTQARNVMEGPFMHKRKGTYYLMYSAQFCTDSTYNVQYATSESITGTYTYGGKVLGSNVDGSVDGPGHHCVMDVNDNSYIIYHRHDNPHSTGGAARQQCINVMGFDEHGGIGEVNPMHAGVGYLGPDQNPFPDLCFGKKTSASSWYRDEARGFDFKPAYAVDGNNATLWKAGNAYMGNWLKVDLGAVRTVARTMVEFQYPSLYYQYLVEYSTDGSTWQTFADRRANRRPGCPMVDAAPGGLVKVRYLKLTITGTEKPGQLSAVWNFKAFEGVGPFAPVENPESGLAPAPQNRGNCLVKLDASTLTEGILTRIDNAGTLEGVFRMDLGDSISVGTVDGRKAIRFNQSRMKASFRTPPTLSYNSPFTVAAWVYAPTMTGSACVLQWSRREGPAFCCAAMMYGTSPAWGAVGHWGAGDMGWSTPPQGGTWNHIAIVYDGNVEKAYLNGVLNNQAQKYLNVWGDEPFYLGGNSEGSECFNGFLATLHVYDAALSPRQVKGLMNGNAPSGPASIVP